MRVIHCLVYGTAYGIRFPGFSEVRLLSCMVSYGKASLLYGGNLSW